MSILTNFFRWWFDELAGLVPSAMRRALRGSGQFLVLDIADGQVVFSFCVGGNSRELGRINPVGASPATLRQEARKLAGGVNLRKTPIAIRLPAEKGLRKTLVLPLAALSDLRQALRYQIDRQTPFTQDEIYFDYVEGARDVETERLTVDLTVVPKTVVDSAVDTVAAWGLQPDIVDVADAADSGNGSQPRLNLIRDAGRAEGGRGWRRFNLMLALLALMLFGAAVYLPLERYRIGAESLTAQVAAARKEAGTVLNLREEMDRLDKEGNFLIDRKRVAPPTLQILQELTGLIPDDTWVSEVEIKEDGVKVSGYSAAASTLIALIDGSPIFETPGFRSPVTQDARTGLERFTLSFKLEKPEK